jgi:capsular polysaccharide biosynthesis protein
VDFKELFRILRRRWKTIAAMFLLAVVISGVISAATPKRYESTASVFVTADARNISELGTGSFAITGRVASYASLASQRGLMQRVIARLNLTLSPDQLASRVSAEVPEGTSFVDISAKEDTADKAQKLSTALSEEFVKYIEELETPNGQDASQIKATITDPATFNGDPVAPQTMLNLIIAALLGLVLGAGLALVRDLLDNTVKSVEDVEEVTGAPVMASVGIDKTMSKQPMLTDVKGFSPRGEAFRMLRTNLQYLDLDNPPKSLVITSAIAGEGKTSTSTNLAVDLAQAGRRVLLIDGDLRRPRVASLLGLESSVGLTTVLVGRTKLEESIQRHQASGVYFLAGGPTPLEPHRGAAVPGHARPAGQAACRLRRGDHRRTAAAARGGCGDPRHRRRRSHPGHPPRQDPPRGARGRHPASREGRRSPVRHGGQHDPEAFRWLLLLLLLRVRHLDAAQDRRRTGREVSS